MQLKEREVRAIKSKFPNGIAVITPIFDETEGQLYDYTAMGIKPSEFYDERLKPRSTSTMITMKRGPRSKDGSFPSFDIQFWPPVNEGGTRTDACGQASNNFYPEEILEALIENTQFGIGYTLEVPAPAVDPATLDIHSVTEGTAPFAAPAARSTPSPIGAKISVPSNADQMRADRDREMAAELARIEQKEALEEKRKADLVKKNMTTARNMAPPRPSANKLKADQRALAQAAKEEPKEAILEAA